MSQQQQQSSFEQWAQAQLARLLPLDPDSLAQVTSYAASLPKDAASDHLRNLLGDAGPALEFIAAFNQRRPGAAPFGPPATSTATAAAVASGSHTHDGVPPRAKRGRGGRKDFNRLPPPRQVAEHQGGAGAYIKRGEEQDYMAGGASRGKKQPLASTLALQSTPDAVKAPTASRPDPTMDGTATGTSSAATSAPQSRSSTPRLPPSASGPLISDSLGSSRTASPQPPHAKQAQPKAKVNLTGGTAMRGASSALTDLDSAIKQLEAQTNPALADGTSEADRLARSCACQATRHALLAAAPNCTSCGKIICAREGLGPCTFCGAPLLRRADLAAMLRALKDERGAARTAAHNAAHARPAVAAVPRPFTSSPGPSSADVSDADADADDATTTGEAAALSRARAHRDKLISFQAQNTQRTTVHDEAADFDTPAAGQSAWATPSERAAQLRRQQAVLRAQRWDAAPAHEKRRVVVSIDVASGRAVRRIESVARDEALASLPDEAHDDDGADDVRGADELRSAGGGGFARNPLLGSLVRPVWKPGADEEQLASSSAAAAAGDTQAAAASSRWRRVQDDGDDNEAWILDGGAYGDRTDGRVLGAEEAACG